MNKKEKSIWRLMYTRMLNVSILVFYSFVVMFEVVKEPILDIKNSFMSRVKTKRDMRSIEKAMKDTNLEHESVINGECNE